MAAGLLSVVNAVPKRHLHGTGHTRGHIVKPTGGLFPFGNSTAIDLSTANGTFTSLTTITVSAAMADTTAPPSSTVQDADVGSDTVHIPSPLTVMTEAASAAGFTSEATPTATAAHHLRMRVKAETSAGSHHNATEIIESLATGVDEHAAHAAEATKSTRSSAASNFKALTAPFANSTSHHGHRMMAGISSVSSSAEDSMTTGTPSIAAQSSAVASAANFESSAALNATASISAVLETEGHNHTESLVDLTGMADDKMRAK